MYLKIMGLGFGVLLLGVIGYGSYEFITFESLKSACIAKEVEKAKIVNIYFDAGTNESLLPALVGELRLMGNVADITTISSEEALTDFKQRHANDSLTLQAVEELGTNPMGPTINVKFDNLDTLAENESPVMAEIEARSAAQELHPNRINSRARGSQPLLKDLKRTTFIEEVVSGSYVSKKEMLQACVSETAPVGS